MKNIFLTFFVSLAIFLTSNHLIFAQINPANSPSTQQTLSKKQEKLKNKVLDIGVGGKITVVKINKKKFFGTVSDVTAGESTIREIDLKTELTFNYTELKSIYEGDGEKNLITGKRNNPQHGWIYAGALVGTVFVILLTALSQDDS